MNFYSVTFYTRSDPRDTILVYASSGEIAEQVAREDSSFAQMAEGAYLLRPHELSRWSERSLERARLAGEQREQA